MKFNILMSGLALGCFVLASAQDPVPVETCGGDAPKTDAELIVRDCPDGYVGQWYQERAAKSCDWMPKEPQWFACSVQIEPNGMPPDDPVDLPSDNGPGLCEKPYPASSVGCPK